MNYSKSLRWLTVVSVSAAITLPSFAQEKKKKGDQPSESEMMAAMMELAKPGENHKLLERLVGGWTYTVKMWMNPDPKTPPLESSGNAAIREIMNGRFFISDHIGKMTMPGPDGKMMDMEFKGMSIEGYDNVKKKFVASWVDNMGTGIMNLEGIYNAPTKTFMYRGEYEPMPGMKTKVREMIKVIDHDHHTFEFYEDRDGKEVRTMEIQYTRKS